MPPGFCLGGFRCEPPEVEDEIGDYLTSGDAARDQKVGFSRTYLVYDTATGALIGYYTLLADAIKLAPDERPAQTGEALWPYESAPAIKIARLGVSHTLQGQGVGKALFGFIQSRILEIAEQIGVRYITLDAVHKKIGFYKRLGFGFIQVEQQASTEANRAAGDRGMLYDLGAIEERPGAGGPTTE